jgi:hypothetical protein
MRITPKRVVKAVLLASVGGLVVSAMTASSDWNITQAEVEKKFGAAKK